MANKKTKIIGFFGGPGVGKSTTAHSLMAALKEMNFNAEYVAEYAKKYAWEEKTINADTQIYIAAKQMHEQSRLYGKVDYIITDSPVQLAGFYYQKAGSTDSVLRIMSEHLQRSRQEYNLDFTNILLTRNKEYEQKGRFQTENEAKNIDMELEIWLRKNEIAFQKMTCKDKDRVKNIMELLKINYVKHTK